jgi:hypothetical protein
MVELKLMRACYHAPPRAPKPRYFGGSGAFSSAFGSVGAGASVFFSVTFSSPVVVFSSAFFSVAVCDPQARVRMAMVMRIVRMERETTRRRTSPSDS